MDVVCVQDSSGTFHYTEFYVKFKIAVSDQALLALIGAGDEASSRNGGEPLDEDAIASMARKDVELSTPPPEPAWIVIFVNGKQLTDVMAFVGLGQIMHFYDSKTKKCFVTPPQEYFRRLGVKPGKNKIVCWHRDTDTSIVFYLYWFGLHDNLVVMDIDGTITKSDLKGYIQTVYLGMFTYIHDGVADFLSTLSVDHNFKLVYLTSRPMGHRKETVNFLRGVRGKNGQKLPDGPLFTAKSRLMVALYKEVITRETAQLKSGILQNVLTVFQDAGMTRMSPFVLGIGNKENDALAYNSVGLPGENILLINTNSRISVWKHSNFPVSTSGTVSASSSAPSSRFGTPMRMARALNAQLFSSLTVETAVTKAPSKSLDKATSASDQRMPPPPCIESTATTLSNAENEREADATASAGAVHGSRLEPKVRDDETPGPSEDYCSLPLPPPPPSSPSMSAFVAPSPSSAPPPALPLLDNGEEVVHFQSYSDPNLLRYVERTVALLQSTY